MSSPGLTPSTDSLMDPWANDRHPRRVVSLVPSITESLFELGFGEWVAGITDYCIYPPEKLVGLVRVGGTKNARLQDILSLRPELVLANQEENTPDLIDSLRAAGVPVWVSFPKTARQAVEVLWLVIHMFQNTQAAGQAVMKVRSLESALDYAEAAGSERLRTFCPIWYSQLQNGMPWWMVFNQETYPHDVLYITGSKNVFGARSRRYPLEADLGLAQSDAGEEDDLRDRRYPRVSLQEIRESAPEVILLPSEPYLFDEGHRTELEKLLADTPAVRSGRIYLVDGSLLTWHGVRLGRALQELPALFV